MKSILKKIGVLYGGEGFEREVSLKSGEAVIDGLVQAGFDVRPFRINTPAELIQMTNDNKPDIFFIALHGSWGENGQVQALLDLMGFPYTGPGYACCSFSMDKWTSKSLFRMRGVPVPDGFILERDHSLEKSGFSSFSDTLPFSGKVVIKPNSCGSTVGVTILEHNSDISAAIELAFRFSRKVLVEEYIPGRELAVTVIEEKGHIRVLPVVEILPKEDFYTYDAKYCSGKSEYLVPAILDEGELHSVNEAAKGAFSALGCRVYARVDIRLSDGGEPCVLEVNTVPGMTSTSLVPKAARAAGIPFPDFLRLIVKESLFLRKVEKGDHATSGVI